MKISNIEVPLTEAQTEKLDPLFDQVATAAQANKPGMVLAQIFNGSMKAFFITETQAQAIQKIMGTRVGMTKLDVMLARVLATYQEPSGQE